jgi:transposase
MLVQRAYKTELDLNNRQIAACKQHAGAARWAYNWGLRVKQERYKSTKRSPTAIDLHRDLNAAINLSKLAASLAESQNACGATTAGTKCMPRVQLAVRKQEPNALQPLDGLKR